MFKGSQCTLKVTTTTTKYILIFTGDIEIQDMGGGYPKE